MTYILGEADRPIARETAKLIARLFDIERLTAVLNGCLVSSRLRGTSVIDKVTYPVDREDSLWLDGLSNRWIGRVLEAYFDYAKVLALGDDLTLTAVVISDSERSTRCRYYGIRLLVSPIHADQP